jgi:site-specific recombinase XerD
MSLSLLHNQFCQYKITFENLSPKTIEWHEYFFRSFLRCSELKEVEQVTKISVEKWIIWGRTVRNWSPKTAKGAIVSINVFLNWSVEQNIILENPAKKIPKPKLSKKIPKHLSLEQAEKLLLWVQQINYRYDYEKNRAVAMIAMFMYSGIRFQELRSLTLADVDFVNKVITINGGKGDKDRMIPLAFTLQGYLKPYLLERTKTNPYSIYFFVSRDAPGKISEKALRRVVTKIRETSKIFFTPHMLRHTFATLMLEGGCDVFALSKMLGHSDIKTTTIYLTATVKHLQFQIKKHPLE